MRRRTFENIFYSEGRPVSGYAKPPKRRRTLVDALERINISENPRDEGVETSPILLNAIENFPTTSDENPQEEFMIDAEDDDDDDDYKILTAEERAEREIVRALALGKPPPPQLAPQRQDPVEQRLEDLIRGSMQRAISQESQCDMDIVASYNRPSAEMGSAPCGSRPRSNSLPTEFSPDDMAMDF